MAREKCCDDNLRCNCVEWSWEELPRDILQLVTAYLEPRDLQQARLACGSWRQGLSLGVAKLKPRMEANSLGLQWSQLHKLQATFPCVRHVDLRQWPPLSCHGAFFADLTSLQRVYISSVQRPSEPAALAAEISGLATAIQENNPSVKIDLELRFGDSNLFWNSSSMPGGKANGIESVLHLPENVEVTLLNLPQLCNPLPAHTFASVMRLTQLRHLRLITYGAHISDHEFASLSGMVHLRMLWFGCVPWVTDAGLMQGLGQLTELQEVSLYDVGCITDVGVTHLSSRLLALESLSLSKCHHLTDKSLACLSRLPLLTRVFLSDNEHITGNGAKHFSESSKLLTVRQCPNVDRSDIHV